MADARELASDLEAAISALRWYAEPSNYRKPRGVRKSPVMKDRGAARRATCSPISRADTMEDLTSIELIVLGAAGLGIAIIGFVIGTVFGIERERLRHFRETFGHLVPQLPPVAEGYQPVAPAGFSGPGKPPTGGSGVRQALAPNPPPTTPRPAVTPKRQARRLTTCHSCKGVGMIDYGPAENICGVCMGSGRVVIA